MNMVSHDDDKLDFGKLQKELDEAVAQDEKYWRENDAKIRAVTTQKVATYEEFKDLVAACHLKPLEKGENIERMISAKQIWNPANQSKKDSQIFNTSATTAAQEKMKAPKSGQDFARDWQHKYKTQEQRYAYLTFVGADHLAKIFKTEVSFGLLGDILSALTLFTEEDSELVANILNGIRESARFKLSLQFLCSQEKEMCSLLFQRLLQISEQKGLLHLNKKLLELQASYTS